MRPSPRHLFIGRIAASFSALALVATGAGGAAATVVAPISAVASVMPVPALAHVPHQRTRYKDAPPTTADCQATYQINCYSPNQLERAYGVNRLFKAGIDGRGTTIALVDAFGSPTIQHDLDVFDQAFGLPAGHVSIIQPDGPVTFDPTSSDEIGWAEESTLDVEYAHAYAPKAKLLLVETPVTETEGTQGFPEIVQAENYVVKHHLADVISQSFGATENTFTNPKRDIGALRSAFVAAKAAHITVLASSGDDGATDTENDLVSTYPYRVTSWPTSDPLVTGVGGTMLSLDATGNRTAPDTVWNDGYGAGGGGQSIVFPRPAFQNGVANVTGAERGVPDISMSAAVNGGAIVYLGIPGDQYDGFQIFGGTSESSPSFAGIIALADQLGHHDVGDINPALYEMRDKRWTGEVDVTKGDNSFAGVDGFAAKPGYDLASGWGTVDAPKFVAALSLLAR